MFYFILFVILVCYVLWIWRKKTRERIIDKSNKLMEAHNLFIRKLGTDDNPTYFICTKTEDGNIHYQLKDPSYSSRLTFKYKDTNLGFTSFNNIHDCWSMSSEMFLRTIILAVWGTVLSQDTFIDIKPPSKNTPKVDNLISELVKAEIDGDKEKVELIFNQYLNDK